ncbi:2-dehydro-3-deoxygalactonokinase [Paracoccus tegillarcae]|uniref:2-keto-3-deoxy-galactonokinase n=1 Tax=Paracoccus tegillarcae TaxID=1529068 RepID=A0A2K9ECV0_9RHOB|nr:2-dehydro-3-deoxygalactonokinase [Paracoccus tegillarcae]AUH32740.1 2-keto-3-deoxy-galactonokinase [Paracoccus tegillarcae]
MSLDRAGSLNGGGALRPDWIALDWGSSNLRAYAIGDGQILAEASGPGAAELGDAAAFEAALLAVVGPWLGDAPMPMLACGMVGSRQGWVEAPYLSVPAAPLDNAAMVPVPARDPRIALQILPGMRQDRPADVMRGEETQIAGLLALRPDFDGVVCLPGTHSKWARISAGEVVGFQTAMTGELFHLLSTASVLRHGMGDGWDQTAFDDGVAEGRRDADRLLTRLFTLRAEGLMDQLSADAASARLSGLLIGAELTATRGWWLGQDVALIGTDTLTQRYAAALAQQGIEAQQYDGGNMALAGLARARTQKGGT